MRLDAVPKPRPAHPALFPTQLEPVTRDVAAPDTDTLGVRVTYTHQWVTKLFRDSTVFTSEVEYHLEPQTFDTDG